MKQKLPAILALCLAAALFLWGVGRLEAAAAAEGRAQLETALRRAAVACYAQEGVYPPDVAYLQTHYGIRVDDRFVVAYESIAGNLMPNITVLEREP